MNARMVRLCALALALSALGGCATAYQSKGMTGGFSETMLSPDTFKINFSGNGFTSAERASDFAILRAADKSLEMGCNYFGVMNEADGASVGSATIGSAGWSGHHAWAFSNTVPIVKPNTNLLVKCYRDPPPGMSLFDAHFIAQSIRAKYGIKTAPIGVGMGPAAPTAVAPSAPAMSAPSPVLPAASMAPVSPTADVATLVRSAQQIASQQGCGDVHSAGGSTFKAQCTNFTLVIDCDAQSCQAVRAVNN
jgi:hypothetical protein